MTEYHENHPLFYMIITLFDLILTQHYLGELSEGISLFQYQVYPAELKGNYRSFTCVSRLRLLIMGYGSLARNITPGVTE